MAYNIPMPPAKPIEKPHFEKILDIVVPEIQSAMNSGRRSCSIPYYVNDLIADTIDAKFSAETFDDPTPIYWTQFVQELLTVSPQYKVWVNRSARSLEISW